MDIVKQFTVLQVKLACIVKLLIEYRLAVFHQLFSWTLEMSYRQNDWLARPSDSLSSFLSTTCTSQELFYRKWSYSVALEVRSFREPDRLISRLRSKFYDQYSADDILSQGHLMVVSVPCDISKDPFKYTFFEMNKFPKKEPLNFCKVYDNEGTTQLLLQSDHFINPTVWYFAFGLNFTSSILVMVYCHKGI